MRLPVLLFLFFFVGLGFLKSQNDSLGKYTFETYPSDPMGVRKYVLKNGLTVYTSVNRNEPRIYTCIAIAAGSKHDPKDNTGLAHYLEHLLFKGTDQYGTKYPEKERIILNNIEELYEKYTRTDQPEKRKQYYHLIDSLSSIAAGFAIPNEYDKMMQFIGAKGTNAYTSFDETVYINDIPSNQFDAWLKIEAERFRNPVFRLFHTELEAVYEEKNMSLDSDSDKLFEVLMQALFKNHTYGLQTTIGKAEHLKNPSLKAIRNYYNTYYVPNNMAICLAGNFNPDLVVAKIDEAFSAFKRVNFKGPKFKSEQRDSLPEYLTVKGPEQEMVSVAWRLKKSDVRQGKILELISELVYNGTTGLIDRNLLNNQRILSGSAEVLNLKDYAVFVLSGEPQNSQKLQEVSSVLLAQIDTLLQEKISEEQVEAAILNIKTRRDRMIENSSSRAFEMVELFIKDFDLKEVKQSDSLFGLLKKKDVIQFVRENFSKDHVVVYKEKDETYVNPKIEKPEITPVPLNRKDDSQFASMIYKLPVDNEYPKFIDFNRSVQKLNLGNSVDGYYVKNTTNTLFKYQIIFEFGRIANPYLPVAMDLFQLSGTAKTSNQSIKETFYKIACDFNFVVGDYTTTLEITGPEKSFERAIATLDNWILNAITDNETIRLFVKSQMQQRENMITNPDAIRLALNSFALYGENNPFNRQISNKQLKSLNASVLKEHISSLFNYPHAISYYGIQDKTQIENLINKNHKAEVKLPLPLLELFKPQKHEKTKIYFADFNMVQANISWLASGSGIDTVNFATSALYNEYFGGGMSSIIFQEIRESKALAYSAYAYFRNPAYKEGFETSGAFIGTQADKLDSAITSMNRLLTEMPLSDNLFRTSKSALLSSIESERLSPRNYTNTSLAYKRQGIDYDFRSSIYKNLKKLELKDIAQFHKMKTGQTTYALTVVGSKKYISKSSLSNYGKVEMVSVKSLLGFK
jgi:predicted Zn-dependent peptidase